MKPTKISYSNVFYLKISFFMIHILENNKQNMYGNINILKEQF